LGKSLVQTVIRESFRWHSKWPGDGRRLSRLPRCKIPRRQFIAGLLASPIYLAAAREPETSAFDLSLLDEGVTPNELFFVREHFPAPSVSIEGWKLSVKGAVSSPSEISYEELLQSPKRTLPVTIECAENPVGGGLVSHASWEGTGLADLLRKAQPDSSARFARLAGADGFSRAIPLEKAFHTDTLLAYRMNGQSLPPSHGGPLRAIVPGWYGTDSLKWLQSVELLADVPTTKEYRRHTRSLLTGAMAGDPVTGVLVKSVFSRPRDGAVLAGRRFVLRGAAWAGENLVRSIEISVDSGKSWIAVEFSPSQRYCWAHWKHEWKIPGAGEYELLVRATDDKGVEQPLSPPSNRLDPYEQNSCQRVIVTVV
jgi:DMSO/TMAO reductase YedYZ molybdopterin-dependent catalytic subunit